MILLIVMAIVQGLAEFLPISSSGHLAFINIFWPVESPVFISVMLHVGTLVSVLIAFRNDILSLLKGLFQRERKAWVYSGHIILTTAITSVLGLGLKDLVHESFNSLYVIASCWLITAALLIYTDRLAEGEAKLDWKKAAIVGLAQAGALFPGISRSGATLIACLMLGMGRTDALRYAFLISIPAIAGATVLESREVNLEALNFSVLQIAISVGVSAIVGLFAIYLLRKLVQKGKLRYFSFYLIPLALASLYMAVKL